MAADEQTPDAAPEQEPARPLLRVVSPDATPEEVAALVAVLSSMGGAEAPAPKPRPEWGAPHRSVRRTLPHGPGGWRSSALPR
ncbi:acyl-CoA carboxylase subunit epsilon [Nocardioides sp. SOB77]|uniref:Acyl-CoA carboxylase subunit epsilon n=1 Tax=Nocardioides oceani TaxID=3058369 RepID=A0ABT8FGM1_9ACTN|nr:acyl-CoA carboxylase subunit epsilon [Nocardioides oceani]MDN4173600.1 acyl-CoA carboxylase subunit epsilon [Nocardioides oceani]